MRAVVWLELPQGLLLAAEERTSGGCRLVCHSVVNGFRAAGTGVGCLFKTNLANKLQRLRRASVVPLASKHRFVQWVDLFEM